MFNVEHFENGLKKLKMYGTGMSSWRVRLQVHTFVISYGLTFIVVTHKSSAPTGSGSKKQILIQNIWKI